MLSFLKSMSLVLAIAVLVFPGITLAGGVIQTQKSDIWDGIQADLLDVKVKNNVLTVKMELRNTGDKAQKVNFVYKECYIMDETNKKKYFVLKDSDGQYIGGPKEQEYKGGYFNFKINPSSSMGVWMKFPEPAGGPKTISIIIPGVFPFEEVGLSK